MRFMGSHVVFDCGLTDVLSAPNVGRECTLGTFVMALSVFAGGSGATSTNRGVLVNFTVSADEALS